MSTQRYGPMRPWMAMIREGFLRSKSRFAMLWSQRKLEVESGVRVASTVRVRGSGRVILRAGAQIDSYTTLIVHESAVLEIGPGAKIGANSILNVRSGQRLEIGAQTIIENDVQIVSVSGVRTGTAAVIGARTAIVCREPEGAGEFSLGARSHLSIDNLVDICGDVVIGADVRSGPSCAFYTHKHTPSQTELIWEQPVVSDAISIGDAVWIGHGCQMMPGVAIGDRAVIGAGAVVTKSVVAGTVVGGVPARVIGGQ